MLNSQKMRMASPEADPLWLGSGKTVDDLEKPQILIESTFGDSHPGSRHLGELSQTVKNQVYAAQGMPSVYTCTDICDGVATGHNGMNYSLVSREVIAGMVEIHVKASAFDGIVALSSCDKSVPGHLIAIARNDIPAIHIPGGSMMPGPSFITADSCYETDMRVAEGKMTPLEERYVQCNACPSSGSCQYIGTASTMQIMSEALGMALPGSALAPAGTNIISSIAAQAGKLIVDLVKKDIRPSKILTKEAFINAIKIHAAVGGSTNGVLHLPRIAKELNIDITLDDFEKYAKDIPLLTSLMTAGKWPTQFFYLAGGVPRIMLELKDYLNLDLPTVTGKTIRENLKDLEETGYFRRCEEYLNNYNLNVRDIIKSVDKPEGTDSGISILKGNIAPMGSVIKHYAVDKSMHHFIGNARVFETEEEVIDEIYNGKIKAGDIIVLIYKGIKAAGMPEMLKTTDAILNKPELSNNCALITDGRFSGASRGPSVGYLLPEAAEGGPIGLVKDGDIIEIDIEKRAVNVIGFDGKKCSIEEVDAEFEKRKKTYVIKKFEHKGVLKFLDV